jgi:hypothetical protein
MSTMHGISSRGIHSQDLRPRMPGGDARSVLIAMDDGARRRMRTVLAACRLTFVRNAVQLSTCLEVEAFGLVLVGSRFDAGRVAAALHAAVRTRPDCPVVCVATTAFSVGGQPSCYTAFRSECLALGAYDTLDLTRWPDDPQGNAGLRSLFDSVLSGRG